MATGARIHHRPGTCRSYFSGTLPGPGWHIKSHCTWAHLLKNKTQQLRLLSKAPLWRTRRSKVAALGWVLGSSPGVWSMLLPSFQDPRIRATSAQVGYFIFIYVLSNSKLQKALERARIQSPASPFIGSEPINPQSQGRPLSKTRCYSSEPQGPSMTATPHWSFFQPSCSIHVSVNHSIHVT